jgi:hypothetical protein
MDLNEKTMANMGNKASPRYKILLSNSEIIMTDNKEGATAIVMAMR